MSFMLLVGSALLLKSFSALMRIDTGFDARAFEADGYLYGNPAPDAEARLSKAHDPADVIDDICAVVIGDNPAYRTIVPTDARAEVHGIQAATWAWSSGPYTHLS